MRAVVFTISLFWLLPVIAQNDAGKKEALALAKQALDLSDKQQNYTQALNLLVQARKLDPKNPEYQYETAYIYYLQKNYDRVIKELKRPVGRGKAPDARFFQLLGNAYDLNNRPDDAIDAYKDGIKQFPDAGNLYLELGGMAYKAGNNDEAVEYWEQGIQNAPSFASNYYWAAKLYCHSSEKIWGILYGELFMLLEPNSARSEEMSSLLFDTYRDAMVVNPNSSWQNWVSFSERAHMYIMLGAGEENEQPPFQVAVDDAMTNALKPEMNSKNINAICRLRQLFLDNWIAKAYNMPYQNMLFDWWRQVKDAGYLEAYTYWLFRKGNPDEFDGWLKKNNVEFKTFLQWYNSQPLKLSRQQRFYRLQYL